MTVTLGDCPPGLFLFNVAGAVGCLGFKSEYVTESQSRPGFWQSDAYVVETGLYFWGGVSDPRERENLMVTPVDYDLVDLFHVVQVGAHHRHSLGRALARELFARVDAQGLFFEDEEPGASESSKWAPIETAPKYPLDEKGHGPPVLAWGMGVKNFPVILWNDTDPRVPSYSVIHWVESEFERDIPAGEVDGQPVFRKEKQKGGEYWGPNPQQFRPTHWRPLPAPPADISEFGVNAFVAPEGFEFRPSGKFLFSDNADTSEKTTRHAKREDK